MRVLVVIGTDHLASVKLVGGLFADLPEPDDTEYINEDNFISDFISIIVRPE